MENARSYRHRLYKGLIQLLCTPINHCERTFYNREILVPIYGSLAIQFAPFDTMVHKALKEASRY